MKKEQSDLRKINVDVSMVPFCMDKYEPKDIGYLNIEVKAVGRYAFLARLVKFIERETGEDIFKKHKC